VLERYPLQNRPLFNIAQSLHGSSAFLARLLYLPAARSNPK